MDLKLSESIDNVIHESLFKYETSHIPDNPFEELISMGELVDRLSIVNVKLYNLKDDVMDRPEDEVFRSWASEEDVKLCRERSRLKRCIDEKLITMIQRVQAGDETAGFNSETKKYGNDSVQ